MKQSQSILIYCFILLLFALLKPDMTMTSIKSNTSALQDELTTKNNMVNTRPRRILIDQSHDYTFLWDWRMGKSYLAKTGFQYSRNMATLDPSVNSDLRKYDALMIPQVWSTADFLPEETDFLTDFVRSGGGLLLLGVAIDKHDVAQFPMHKLAKEFGIQFNQSISAQKPLHIINHEITSGVTNYDTEAKTIGTINVPTDWEPFLVDNKNNIVGAAGTFGNGKIIAFSDHFLINMDTTHNHLLVENIAKWISANTTGYDNSFTPPERIYPENTLKQDLITYKYSKNLEHRILFLYNNYDRVSQYLNEMMSVDCIYHLTILALAGGGGGYSSADEIGIGLLTSDEYALAVMTHEMTHSWQQPGGEPPWMGEGWAVLTAERVLKRCGGEYADWAKNEYKRQIDAYIKHDSTGTKLDLDQYAATAPIPAYTGKFFRIIENLEKNYGNDLMQRYFRIRRKYYDPAIHGKISTQKTIYFLSLAAGQELFTYFKAKGTSVEIIPLYPIICNTSPQDGKLSQSNTKITIFFNTRMDSTTINSDTIKINGSESGSHSFAIEYLNTNHVAQIKPVTNFKPGELVTVEVTNHVQDVNGNMLDGNGNQHSEKDDSYIFKFEIGN